MLKISLLIHFRDLDKIARIFNSTEKSIVSLRIKSLDNHHVIIRTGTVDYKTLIQTFGGGFHLPFQKLPTNPVILDLGCNIGLTTAHYAFLFPNAQVIGVEIDLENFQIAQKTTQNFSNCTVMKYAVSDINGKVSYNKNSNLDAYQLQHSKEITTEEEIMVNSITIASLIRQLGLNSIDFLKMDVESEEEQIFNEAKINLDWLQTVGVLNIELHNSAVENRIISTIEKRGFTVTTRDKYRKFILANKSINF